ncbi:acyl-CoA dehydrogenase family protein [Leptolyngbya sp. 7M]|nr:acyl-CoA dehydrogenase family protein [Leptolyngbya sp. 7M]
MMPQNDMNWLSLTASLGEQFAAREIEADETDVFVADNIARLKTAGLIAAGVPTELGGGGASYTEMCAVLRILGRYCSSTALAFAMHTHQVMVPTWRWHNQQASVDGLLKRIAAEQLVLLSSGGSDWLQSSVTSTSLRASGDGSPTKNVREVSPW